MEWWGWLTWGITAAIAAGALVLGIRAERRATRYEPRWVFDSGFPTRAINRTGEDATKVAIEVKEEGVSIFGANEFDLVPPNGAAELRLIQTDGAWHEGTAAMVVTWTRHRTGKRYQFPR